MLIKTKIPPPINEVTQEERIWVQRLYVGRPNEEKQITDKLVLKQIEHMPDSQILLLCSWVDSTPFARLKKDKWRIERGYDVIGVNGDIHSYHIEIDTGNVHVYLDGRLSTMGKAAYAYQFYIEHLYAFPLHWAKGKNALQLGIALPDRTPMNEALLKLYDNDKSKVDDYYRDKLFHNIDLNNVDTFNSELTEIKKQLARKG